MVGIVVNPEAATYAFPITQRGRYTVELDVFQRLADAGLPAFPNGSVNRVRIAELPSVWPAGALREKALEGGRLFLQAMKQQGLEPLTELEGLTVIGPYHHRRFERARAGAYATARRDGEVTDPDSADFVLEGLFLEKRGRIVETKA